MKKPFLIEIATVAVVMAEDESHAEDVGRQHAREARVTTAGLPSELCGW